MTCYNYDLIAILNFYYVAIICNIFDLISEIVDLLSLNVNIAKPYQHSRAVDTDFQCLL